MLVTEIHDVLPGDKKLKKDLEYWLENLEKQFVYYQCREKYGLDKDGVNSAIIRMGLEHVKFDPEG